MKSNITNFNPSTYNNISDLLVALGFTWSDEHKHFRRDGQFIVPEDWYGHTPETFYRTLQEKLKFFEYKEGTLQEPLPIDAHLIPVAYNVMASRVGNQLTVSWEGLPSDALTEIEYAAGISFALFRGSVQTSERHQLTLQAHTNTLFVRVRFWRRENEGPWCEPVLVYVS